MSDESSGIKSYIPEKRSNFSANNFLKAMVYEQRHGNDIYLAKIWRKFNPMQNFTSSQKVITIKTFSFWLFKLFKYKAC